jgi:hypothetical protein
VGWWQLALQPGVIPSLMPEPQSPLSFTEIQRDPSWQRMLAAGLSCIREA